MLAVLAPTARDSSARAGLAPGPGGGLRVSLGRRASPHPTAEPLPPPRGHPLNQLFSLSAVGGGECMQVPLLVPNSPSLPCTQLCPLPSCPPPPSLQSYQQAHSGDSVGRREPVILGGAGCHPRTSEDLMDLLDIRGGGGAPEAWAPCGKRLLVGACWGHSLPPLPTTALHTVKCGESLALCPPPPNCVVLVSLRLSLCKKRPCTPDELRVDKRSVTRSEVGREGICRVAVGGAWASPALSSVGGGSRWAA